MLDFVSKVWYILIHKERWNNSVVTRRKEGRNSKDAISITNPNYNYNSFGICVAYCDSNKETTYANSSSSHPPSPPPLLHRPLLQALYKDNQAILLSIIACYLLSAFLVLLLILHLRHAN